MNRIPACTSLIGLYLWQAQVSLECIAAAFSAAQKMVAGDWFSVASSNALDLRNFNEGVSMFAKVIEHYSAQTNRDWYQVLYPDKMRQNFLRKEDAEIECKRFNNEIESKLKIGGYKDGA